MFARAFGFGFGLWFGAGSLAAWRSGEGPGLALLVVLALWIAYRGGKWRRGPTAIAMAEARSLSAVQVNVGGAPPAPGAPRARGRDDLGQVRELVAAELDWDGPLSDEAVEHYYQEMTGRPSLPGESGARRATQDDAPGVPLFEPERRPVPLWVPRSAYPTSSYPAASDNGSNE